VRAQEPEPPVLVQPVEFVERAQAQAPEGVREPVPVVERPPVLASAPVVERPPVLASARVGELRRVVALDAGAAEWPVPPAPVAEVHRLP